MTYYTKALSLILQGGRYNGARGTLRQTLCMVALRKCRLHWLEG